MNAKLDRDRRLLYWTAFLRAAATGMMGVLLGTYLARLSLSSQNLGYIISAGLAGCAAASFLAMRGADRHGRRRLLLELSLIGVGGAAIFLWTAQPLLLGVAAFIGMLNGMGRDRSAAFIVEQAILPATVAVETRTRAFAVYNILQDAGHALGSLLAALPVLLQNTGILAGGPSFRFGFVLYLILTGAPVFLYRKLSSSVERTDPEKQIVLSPKSKSILWKISSLFGLDGLGGGFLTTSLLAFFFFERFGVREDAIGLLFFFARVANMASHAGAAWLAGKIGLVKTMVFTHVPSSLLLMTVPFAPSFTIAAILFLIREGLVEMDVPTRQSYVMAVMAPDERMAASGITNLVRLAAWAIAPSLAGLMMQGMSLAMPLFVGAGLKITYDFTLYSAFHKIKPPEES